MHRCPSLAQPLPLRRMLSALSAFQQCDATVGLPASLPHCFSLPALPGPPFPPFWPVCRSCALVQAYGAVIIGAIGACVYTASARILLRCGSALECWEKLRSGAAGVVSLQQRCLQGTDLRLWFYSGGLWCFCDGGYHWEKARSSRGCRPAWTATFGCPAWVCRHANVTASTAPCICPSICLLPKPAPAGYAPPAGALLLPSHPSVSYTGVHPCWPWSILSPPRYMQAANR